LYRANEYVVNGDVFAFFVSTNHGMCFRNVRLSCSASSN
jgi:hypothetical protein